MPLLHMRPDLWQDILDVNVTANWRLIRSLDSLLRQSDAARLVFVSSGAATNFRPYWGPYSITKAALEAMAKTYAAETEKTNIRVNLLNPGPVRTRMRAQAMPGEDPETLPTTDEVAEFFLDLVAPECTRHGQVVKFTR